MARPDYDSLPPAVAKRASHIRGAGYVFYLAGVIYLNAVLMTAIIPHLSDGTARDPFTDQEVGAIANACERWADDLDNAHDRVSPADWKVRALSWNWRCAQWDKESAAHIKDGLRAK